VRDCPLPRVQRGVGLNVVGVQDEQHENELITTLRGQVDLQHQLLVMEIEQHENELITSLRGQVDLQHQLLAAQEGRIQQNDVKVAELAAWVGFMGGTGASVSQLAVMGPQAERAPPLILGGAQPPGYAFVDQNSNNVDPLVSGFGQIYLTVKYI
jgi:hypothetical protein